MSTFIWFIKSLFVSIEIARSANETWVSHSFLRKTYKSINWLIMLQVYDTINQKHSLLQLNQWWCAKQKIQFFARIEEAVDQLTDHFTMEDAQFNKHWMHDWLKMVFVSTETDSGDTERECLSFCSFPESKLLIKLKQVWQSRRKSFAPLKWLFESLFVSIETAEKHNGA